MNPEDQEPIVNPDEVVEQAAEELENLAVEETEEEVASEPVASDGGQQAQAAAQQETEADVNAFLSNVQRLTMTEEEQFRMYDPDAGEDIATYAAQSAAHSARAAANAAFRAQQTFNIMIDRVPEAFRDEIRAVVTSDANTMGDPRQVAQAIAAAVGLKVLTGTATKKTTVAKAPQAARQNVPASTPNAGGNDPAYRAFLREFGMSSKDYPYAQWKAEGVR